jgi:uncharacterized protein YecE (DUF72 family)
MTTDPEGSTSPPPARRIAIGTSGFAYTEWRGSFYPKKLPAKQFLAYYAQHFSTTEVNSTFYRFPRATMTEPWGREVPADFTFTLKMSQRVTHNKRLKDVDREMGWFMDGALALGDKLGPVLVQLPPNFKLDLERLDTFLAKHAPRSRLALEFRHVSWFEEAVYDCLRRHRAALAVVEREEGETLDSPRLATGDFVFMRLRKGEYTDDELRDWADWIQAQTVDVFCYLKHEEAAPLLAQRLMRHLGMPISPAGDAAAGAATEGAVPATDAAPRKRSTSRRAR